MNKLKDNTLDWTPNDLETWLRHKDLSEELNGPAETKLKHVMKYIAKAKDLKEKNSSSEEILALFDKRKKISMEDIEKGLDFYNSILKHRSILTEIISEDQFKKRKFRQSGHLTDQILKYKEPKSDQLSLFDLISPETKEQVENSSIEIKTEGIRLTPTEDKLIKALNKLLYEKSENRDIESTNFYSGNLPSEKPILYGGKGQVAQAPILKISQAELYKAYLDKDNYSGEEIKFIKKLLYTLCEKKFLIIYDRKRKVNGKILTDRIEEFVNLIKIMSYTEGLTEVELNKINNGDEELRERRGELVIGLNPIFRDQIESKYIEYPIDINKRTTIAAGGHHSLNESMITLRDYLLREISSKRFTVEINAETLPHLLQLDKYIEQRKKKIIKERIDSAINLVKNLGILIDFKIVIGSLNQQKYIFSLNKDFLN